jgi:hypothetical protein
VTARRGVTLLLVLVALALVGAAGVALVAVSASLDEDTGAALADAQARAAADAAIWGAWRTWDGAAHGLDAVDRVAIRTDVFDGAVAITRVARIAPRLWWIASTARADRPVGTRPVEHGGALALWMAVDPVDPDAAVLATGPVSVLDQASVTADDVAPDDWPCAPMPAGAAAGIAVADTALVSGAAGRVVGVPPVVGRPQIAAAGTLAALAGARPSIAARAGIVLQAGASAAPAPVDSAGVCGTGASNWGDPRRSGGAGGTCISRFVLVHALGDLRLTGGLGQGVLVVDGIVRMEGNATFAGIVIARNGAILDGASSIRGVLAAGDGSTSAAVRLADAAAVVRSRCTAAAALVGSALVQPVTPSGWFGLW